MQETMVKTQITLPKSSDKFLKMIKVEYDLNNKSEAVEFIIETLTKELRPEIEAKFKAAMKPAHRRSVAKRSKTIEEMNKEMDSW